jgi:hypothetical protein
MFIETVIGEFKSGSAIEASSVPSEFPTKRLLAMDAELLKLSEKFGV